MVDASGDKAESPAAAPPGEEEGAVPAINAAPVDKKKLQTVDNFLCSFIKGAKTMSLYEEGHAMILQIVGRVNNLLKGALGLDSYLSVTVKSKNILYEGAALPESEEMIGFASSLHVLGIGQIVFSDKLKDEGMLQLMKMVTERPDLKRTLVDMQRDVHETRIDGLQLVSILSFVETAVDVEEMTPGQLSEEHVAAFTTVKTIPDFLFLLFYQNEPLTGKKADNLTILFDEVMDRGISLDEFKERMPWHMYPAEIRLHWDRLVKSITGRTKWTRDALLSDLSLLTGADARFKEDVGQMASGAAFQYALSEVHAILAHPAGDKQPKYALRAYVRVLGDLGERGDLAGVIKEVNVWRVMAADPQWAAYLAALKSEVQNRVPTPALARSFVAALAGLSPESKELESLNDLILTIGEKIVPLLLGELRELSDRTQRLVLCAALAKACRHLGTEHLIAALQDPDYLQVVQVVSILSDINLPGTGQHVAPLLKHSHPKVRRAVLQSLRKFGGPEAVAGLYEFIISHEEGEEAKLAVTSLSLVNHPDVEKKLIAAYLARDRYETRVGLATALGRFGSEETLNFLNSIDHWGWLEAVTGKNKELRDAVRNSIAQVKKDITDGA